MSLRLKCLQVALNIGNILLEFKLFLIGSYRLRLHKIRLIRYFRWACSAKFLL